MENTKKPIKPGDAVFLIEDGKIVKKEVTHIVEELVDKHEHPITRTWIICDPSFNIHSTSKGGIKSPSVKVCSLEVATSIFELVENLQKEYEARKDSPDKAKSKKEKHWYEDDDDDDD